MLNKTGHSTDLWGTPLIIGLHILSYLIYEEYKDAI